MALPWSEWHERHRQAMFKSSPHGWEERFSREVLRYVEGLEFSNVYVQVPFGDPGGRRRLMDFAIIEPPNVRVAIEIDDQATHDPGRISREKFNDDVARQNQLIKEGYTPLRFTVPQVRDSPSSCADDIRTTLDHLRYREAPRASLAASAQVPQRLPIYIAAVTLLVVIALAVKVMAGSPPAPGATPRAAVTPSVNGECRSPSLIKGNVAQQSDGSFSRIYHVPSGAFYAATKAEACFETDEDAVTAGYRKSAR
jgi:very-short-patch-repair endonuclease